MAKLVVTRTMVSIVALVIVPTILSILTYVVTILVVTLNAKGKIILFSESNTLPIGFKIRNSSRHALITKS